MNWIVWIVESVLMILFLKKRWKLSVLYAIVVGVLLFFCKAVCIPVLLCGMVVRHLHLLCEEKLYAGLLCLLYGVLFYFSLSDERMVVVTILLTVLLEYMIVRIMKREEDKTIIYQNKLMKQQVDEIQQMYMTMRGWRHDYHNHLQSLKGYLQLNQVEEMKSYLQNLETDLDAIDTLYHSGNLQIDAILNAKLAIAEKDSIRIKCDATLPPVLSVYEIDLCVILGNLIDNAVESCRKIDDLEQRFIRVYLGTMKQQLYISITNATNESVRMRTDSYFTSKRGDHGHGLKRVDDTVRKYHGLVNRQNEPGVFATEILLPL